MSLFRNRLVRLAVRMALALTLWIVLAFISTNDDAPSPECYVVKEWNGRHYVSTGEWRCLE